MKTNTCNISSFFFIPIIVVSWKKEQEQKEKEVTVFWVFNNIWLAFIPYNWTFEVVNKIITGLSQFFNLERNWKVKFIMENLHATK